MCFVSVVGDMFTKTVPIPDWAAPAAAHPFSVISLPAGVTKEEFDALKVQVEEIVKLLKAAKIYDEATNQKDCEQEEKVALLKHLAKIFEIELPL